MTVVVVDVVVVEEEEEGIGRRGEGVAEVDGCGGEVRVARTTRGEEQADRAEEEPRRRRRLIARLGVGGLKWEKEFGRGWSFLFSCELLSGVSFRPPLKTFFVSRSLSAGPGRREQGAGDECRREREATSDDAPEKRKRGREAKFASLSAHSARSSRRLLKPNLPSAAANSHESVSTRGGRPRTGAEGVRWRPNEHRPQRERRGGEPLGSERRAAASEEKKGSRKFQRLSQTPSRLGRTSSPGWARTPFARTSRRRPFRAWSRVGQLSNQAEGARDAGRWRKARKREKKEVPF